MNTSGCGRLSKPRGRTVPTTPTISASKVPLNACPDTCTLTRRVSGSLSGQCCRAKVSLMIATAGPSAPSRSSNHRPARSGIRIVSKYSGVAMETAVDGSSPGGGGGRSCSVRGLSAVRSASGNPDTAAAATPGSARMPSIVSRKKVRGRFGAAVAVVEHLQHRGGWTPALAQLRLDPPPSGALPTTLTLARQHPSASPQPRSAPGEIGLARSGLLFEPRRQLMHDWAGYLAGCVLRTGDSAAAAAPLLARPHRPASTP